AELTAVDAMTGTFRDPTDGVRLAIKGLAITVVSGPSSGRSANAPRGDCLRIGRSVDNDLMVDDLSVSEKHCELRSTSLGWVLYDRSTNGTRINGLRVREAVIEGEMMIDVGNSRIRLQP